MNSPQHIGILDCRHRLFAAPFEMCRMCTAMCHVRAITAHNTTSTHTCKDPSRNKSDLILKSSEYREKNTDFARISKKQVVFCKKWRLCQV